MTVLLLLGWVATIGLSFYGAVVLLSKINLLE